MQQTRQPLERHKIDLERKVEPNHERLCSYWAGCNPFTGEEGHCDCDSKLLGTEEKKNPTRQTTLDEFS